MTDIPEGWKLVPMEPTPEMWEAAWEASGDYFVGDEITKKGFQKGLAAMLASTPDNPPVAEGARMRVLLPPGAVDDDAYLEGWLDGQTYLILNYGSEEARQALSASTSPVAVDGSGGLPQDVVRLIIAARMVAWEDPDPEYLKELQDASEAFAARVPWEDEPDEA